MVLKAEDANFYLTNDKRSSLFVRGIGNIKKALYH